MEAPRPALLALATALTLALSAALAGAAGLESSTFGGLSARQLGPAVMGGRIAALDAVAADPLVIYVGAASGGIWKSVDGGVTFRPVFDAHTQSIGSLAIDPQDPETVWAGTGETWVRNSVSVGDGLYKSTDAGESWQRVGLEQSERIAAVRIHPTDGDTVWACATGRLWSSGGERGVYKTGDGGATWRRVLAVDDDTGCADLSLDPGDPRILYAGMWQFRRQPWTFASGGPGSGLYRSSDGGETWKEMTAGLPAGDKGRIAVAVAPSRPSVVYAVVEAKEKTALYRSDDLGLSWSELNSSFNVAVRPFYFALVVVDPTDHERVYKPGLTLGVSRDGGKSFTSPFSAGFDIGSVHPDHHALWIDPRNPNRLLLGTDGGLYESLDRGARWRHLNNLPISQFYRVAVDLEWPFNVYGGLQDNGSWTGPSRAPGGVRNRHWQNIGYGDGFWAFADPEDRDVVFSEYQGGRLLRVDRRTGAVKDVSIYPLAGDPPYRFNWNTPFLFGPSGTLYVGGQFLFRSTDRGESWEKISPDLTTDDPAKQKQLESGGLTIDNSTAENHTTIYSIAESPLDPRTIWVGTDDGNLQLTRDGGASWDNVVGNVPGLPASTWVSYVEASPHDTATAFVTFDGHRTGDMTPWLFRTSDHGATWQRLGEGALDGFAHVVRQDPERPGLLYAGTEHGLWISLDEGASWARFASGLPPVSVHDLAIQPRDRSLVVGTHGRGVFVIDDLSPLRGLTPEVMDQELAVLPARPAAMVIPASLQEFGAHDDFVALNPPEAASIWYHQAKRHMFGDFRIEILDDEGRLITELPAGMRAGINQVQWPMRLKPPKVAPASSLVPAFEGPRVPEGTYAFRIVKGEASYEGTVELVGDPRSPYSAADRRLQQETALALYRDLEELTWLADTLVAVRDQARERAGEGRGALARRLETYADEVEALRAELVATSPAGWLSGEERLREQIANLYGAVNGYTGRPTTSQLARREVLAGELAQRAVEVAALAGAERLADLSRQLERQALAPLAPPSREEWEAGRDGVQPGASLAGLELLRFGWR